MWKAVKLGDVCDFQNGFAFKSKLFEETGKPILRISNIQNEKIDTRKIVYFNPNDYNTDFTQYEVKPNDLLIAMSGATTGKIGFNKTGATYYLNQRVGNLKPKPTLDKVFLYYLLSTKVQENLNISKGAAQPNLSTEQIKNITFSLPPLTEQKRIVAKLDAVFAEIDNAIEATNTKETEIRNLQASLLGTFLSGNSEKWNKLALQGICSFISRGISPKYVEAGGVRVLNQKCIRNHLIDYSLSRRHDIAKKVVKQERFIKKGDVLINSTGHGTLGRVAQVRDKPEEPTTVDSHITIVRPIAKFFYLDYFGYAAIFIEDGIKSSGQGTSGQTELSRTKLKEEFYISFPTDFKDQQIIVTKLDSAYNEFKKANEVIIKSKLNYQQLKSAILAKELQSEVA